MYGKIFRQIYASSIAQNYKVRHIFMDLIVLADAEGIVDMTPESIAGLTRVPIDDLRQAIAILEKPDAQSRTPDHQGARLIRLDDHRNWGWRIVNYVNYRGIKDEEGRKVYMRKYMKEYRQALKTKDLPVNVYESLQKVNPSSSYTSSSESLEGGTGGNHYHPDTRTVLHFLNESCGKKFREVDANLSTISARLKETDVDLDGVKTMIMRQVKRWKDTKFAEYLQPSTLFGKQKFDLYYAAKDQPIYENNDRTNGQRFDRNKGTANEGGAEQYNLRKIQAARALQNAREPGACPDV